MSVAATKMIPTCDQVRARMSVALLDPKFDKLNVDIYRMPDVYHIEYNWENRINVPVTIKLYSIKWAVRLGTTGAFVGAVGGGLLTKSPVGVVAGSALGAGAGIYAGLKIGHRYALRTITLTDHYQQWRERTITEKTEKFFHEFLASKKEFAYLLCPLSKKIPVFPVKAPCGHTYDEQAILAASSELVQTGEEYQFRKVYVLNCCAGGKQFHKRELVFDDLRANAIKAALDAIILKTAVEDDELTQSFEPQSLSMGGAFTFWE